MVGRNQYFNWNYCKNLSGTCAVLSLWSWWILLQVIFFHVRFTPIQNIGLHPIQALYDATLWPKKEEHPPPPARSSIVKWQIFCFYNLLAAPDDEQTQRKSATHTRRTANSQWSTRWADSFEKVCKSVHGSDECSASVSEKKKRKKDCKHGVISQNCF